MVDRPSLLGVFIRRARVIPAGDGPATPAKKAVFLAELASLGYRVRQPDAFTDAVLEHHEVIIATLREMRGGHVVYAPLFDGFPNAVPRQDRYLVERIVGYLGHLFGTFEEGVELESGLRVPDWLFDLKRFGADPISQLQDRALFEAAVKRQRVRAADPRKTWTELELVPDEDADERAKSYLLGALYAGSSIKEAVRPDLELLLDHFGLGIVEVERVRFKETRTLLMRYLWRRGDEAGAVALAQTPTDLLRLFAALTGTDPSLAEPIEYPRLSRRQRRLILAQLDQASNLAADLKRYRNLWKHVGRGLHPGEYEKRYPAVASAFADLRNDRIVTWEGAVEVALRDRNVDDAIARLAKRPGVFGRRLRHLALVAGDEAARVVAAFREVAPQLTLKNLLVLERHLRTVDDQRNRAVVNKKGTVRVIAAPPPLPAPTREALIGVVEAAIAARIAADKPTWSGKRVWIDPGLRRLTVPLQQRKASDGLLALGRGSKLPLAEGRVLRLFVWWKQAVTRTDLDLSVIAYDEELRYVGHVSWTNLKGGGMVHSGDIQSAPHGAAEFIDIELARLPQGAPDARYLAPQVHRFCGDRFGEMTCFAGWMMRDGVDADYASFDVATVQNKLVLSGEGSYALPMLVDLKRRELTIVDLCVYSVNQMSTAEGARQDISAITREMVRMVDTRPNLLDLARHHVRGRGATEVDDVAAADIRFGIGRGDYDALALERVLADLL